MKKLLCSLIVFVILFTGFPVFAEDYYLENEYRIFMPAYELSAYFDARDYFDGQGIVHAGWGCSLGVMLAVKGNNGEDISDESNRIHGLNDGEYVVNDASWEALLPDGTITKPISVKDNGCAVFQIPFEMTGIMVVKAFVDGSNVAEFKVDVVGTDMYGKKISGWRYSSPNWYYIKNGKIVKGWFREDGKWYYLNHDGVLQTGWKYLKYNKESSWYYFNTDFSAKGSMYRGWHEIDGSWYYFRRDGSMAANEWINGYWLSANGSWKYQSKGRWRRNSKGWWYEDERGWYPKDETVKINGVSYTFAEDGYLVE